MSARSNHQSWGSVTRTLHWLSAAAILFGLVHGYWMTHLLQPREARLAHYILHSTVLVYFALLFALRIVWRLTETRPDDPPGLANWEKTAAHLGHFVLYVLTAALLITGYMNWSLFPARFNPQRAPETVITLFGGWPLPAWHTAADRAARDFWEHAHEYLSWVMAALIVVHILAALRHQFGKHNDVMRRMWSGV